MKKKTLFSSLMILPTLISCGGSNNSSSTTSVSDEPSSSSIQPEVDKTVNISFDPEKANQEISPLIYGTFIEHIGTCIYNGIWSELILDRKFYDPVGVDRSQWKFSGNVKMDSENFYCAPHSVLLKENGEIHQSGIAVEENKDYSGYVYAKGNGKLKIKLIYDEEEIVSDIVVNSTNDFTKYTFSFTSTLTDKKAKIYFICEEGDINIDAMSMMPADNYYGMRKDTLDLLKQLNAPFYRWPGGNFVSGYDWEDGIGDIDKRPCKRNLNYAGLESNFANYEELIANDLMKIGSLGFYGAFEPNDYGLDEFIIMCRYLNAEPNIVVNSGFGTAEQAANEVAYCNAVSGTYASKREQKEPYNVKYFSIGNEMNGDWQLGHTNINSYIVRHNEFYKAMIDVDPTIKIIGVGDNYSTWSKNMLDGTKMDYISEHFYATRDERNSIEHIKAIKKQADMRIGKHRDLNRKDVFMAIDEYAYANAECSSRLKDGMGVALAVNSFIQNSDVVKIACYSSTVNATQGSLTTDKLHAYMQGNGYTLSLYSRNMQSVYLPVVFTRGLFKDYVFEISGTISNDKSTMTLAVVNSGNEKIQILSDKFQKIIKREYVTSESLEDYDKDESYKFNVVIDNDLDYVVVEPLSITTITIKLK